MGNKYITGLVLIIAGVLLGIIISSPRVEGETIIYCIDNPDQCKIEYAYLKLKETQK